MKNTRLTSILNSGLIACALMIGSLASTQVASAQSGSAIAEVTIPFAFHTPTQTLPAGKYRITESGSLIRLQSYSAGGSVMVHDAIRNQAPSHGSVVFARYGDTYYLRQVWTAGDTLGVECVKSRAEKQSLQAKNPEPPSTVELAF
jgi:hypothetical protein